MPKGFMFVMSNPVPGKEDEFNDWYENHLPEVVQVPGIAAAQRFEAVPNMGGQLPPQRYIAVYELDTDDPQEALANLRQARDALSSDMTPAFDLSTVQSYAYRAVGPRAESVG
jgi:hypothetical protein